MAVLVDRRIRAEYRGPCIDLRGALVEFTELQGGTMAYIWIYCCIMMVYTGRYLYYVLLITMCIPSRLDLPTGNFLTAD